MLSVDNNVDAFTLESYPWTTAFKANRKLSIYAEFDRELRRFKERRPMPSVGRIISICGTLSGFQSDNDADNSRNSTFLTLDIHEISFLGAVPQTISAENSTFLAFLASSFPTNTVNVASSSSNPSTPHRALRYGMRGRGIPRSSGNRGQGPSEVQQGSPTEAHASSSASFSSSGQVNLPILQHPVTPSSPSARPEDNLPSLPSTPKKKPSDVIVLPDHARNVRKRRRKIEENVDFEGGTSGSSLSTESTLSDSLLSEPIAGPADQ